MTGQPIAWMRDGHVVVKHHSELHTEFIEYVDYGPLFPNCRRWAELPSDAVELVPRTELDEARAEIERVQTIARDVNTTANEIAAERRTAEAERDQARAERDAALTAASLPDPDSPEALRCAADVVEAFNRRVDAKPHALVQMSPWGLRNAADRLDAERAAAAAKATEDAEVEELARELFDYVPPGADPATGMPGNGLGWSAVTEEIRDTYRHLARFVKQREDVIRRKTEGGAAQ